jgi:putative phosphoesterase
MRIGLISDIHGNLTALEAVLTDLVAHPVDKLICLGDVATLGPQPKQVIARLQELGCPSIMGNHESALLDLENASKYQIASSLVPTIKWCAGLLDAAEMDYLRSFQPLLELPAEDDLSLLCYHGSPQSNIGQILATTPADRLDKYFDGQKADVFIGGHTHIQMMHQYNGKLIVNPGSVGSAFRKPYQVGSVPELLPWAEYGIISVKKGAISVDLRRIPFDIPALYKVIAESGIPDQDWWLKQYSR